MRKIQVGDKVWQSYMGGEWEVLKLDAGMALIRRYSDRIEELVLATSLTPIGPAKEEAPTGGVKHDQDKPRVELIPPDAISGIAHVMTYGAKKYGDRNWEKGIAPSRLLGAALRHLLAWSFGEDEDEESTLPHLWHAGASVLMLIATVNRRLAPDDRKVK